MKALFKDLYRQYLEKGVSPTDFGQFKEELNHIPDEELWNVMIDMEKDATTEIGMPPMMKKQIRKEMHQIIWRRRWIQITKYAANNDWYNCREKPFLMWQRIPTVLSE